MTKCKHDRKGQCQLMQWHGEQVELGLHCSSNGTCWITEEEQCARYVELCEDVVTDLQKHYVG